MKARVLVLAGCMILAGAAAAQADCAGEIANLSGHGGAKAGGISKDGSTAPLEGAGTAATGSAEQAAPSPDGKIAKAVELSGQDNLLFRRNSQSGAVEVIARSGSWGGLNADLHAHN